jgi:DNA polymerase-3 subunit beta
MEVTVPKSELLRSLSRTYGIAERKSSMPILSNVLLQADQAKSTLRLTATDLYLGVVADASVHVIQPGSIAVASRTFFDIIKSLPESDIHLTTTPQHGLHIVAAKARYKLAGMPPDEFPPLPSSSEVGFVEVSAAQVGDLIAKTHYSMSTDETRPHLAGAFFEGEGNTLRMVTTDGHRLSKAEATHTLHDKPLGFSMLVPAKGVMELKRLIEDPHLQSSDQEATLAIGMHQSTAFFRRDGVLLSVKLADEQFPPYSKVIPQSTAHRIIVPRVPLLSALRRIHLLCSDRTSGGVRLQLSAGVLMISTENPEVGEGNEEIEVDYQSENLVVGFNAKYLMDVLGSLTDDEVALELTGPLDPGLIRPHTHQDFVGVIMPMRI